MTTMKTRLPSMAAERVETSPDRLRRGGIVFTANRLAGMVLGVATSVVLVRVANPVEIASYLLLTQAALALDLVLQLGLGFAALRFVPLCRGEGGGRATARLRRRLLGIQVATWLAAAPVLLLAWPRIAPRLNAPELAGSAPLLLGIAMLTSLNQLADAYLRSFRLYGASAVLSHVLPRALLVAGFAWLLGGGGTASWVMLAAIFAVSHAATALCYALALPATTREETSEPRTAGEPPSAGSILATTTALGLRNSAMVLLVSSDLWILSWARPHEDVAVYGMVTRILQVMTAIPAIAGFLLPQEFSLMHADGRRGELEKLARTAATAVGLVSFAGLAGLVLLGRPLIRIAFGNAYVSGWGILVILALGSFWDAACGSAGYLLQMTGHHTRLLLVTLAAAAVNLVASALLAPALGGLGVALATTATLIVLNTSNLRSARRLVGVRTSLHLRPIEWRRTLELMAGRRLWLLLAPGTKP
jgi:O-antigen/teichoic acid export membrane protein